MPRIYYSSNDEINQTVLLLLHGTIYSSSILYTWLQAWQFAPLLSFLWTLLLAYHCFAAYPLKEGMQVRTYDRLRNRFGKDWDLAATTEEFELERKKTVLEQDLKLLFPSTSRSFIPAILISIAWNFLRGELVPLLFILSVVLAYLSLVGLLRLYLHWRLGQNSGKLAALKAKARLANQLSITQAPKQGISYTIGDDGELIEVPSQQQGISKK